MSTYGNLKDLDIQAVATLPAEVGDPALLTATHPAPDLVHWLAWLEDRLADLERAVDEIPSPAIPSAEGSLWVDNYSSGFIRIRDVDGLLADGEIHAVTMRLATTAGPGGAVIQDPPGVPAGANPVWFDRGGALGYVKGSTGTNVTQTTLRNWAKFGDPAVPGFYLLWVSLGDDPTDATKPLLTVHKIATVT